MNTIKLSSIKNLEILLGIQENTYEPGVVPTWERVYFFVHSDKLSNRWQRHRPIVGQTTTNISILRDFTDVKDRTDTLNIRIKKR